MKWFAVHFVLGPVAVLLLSVQILPPLFPVCSTHLMSLCCHCVNWSMPWIIMGNQMPAVPMTSSWTSRVNYAQKGSHPTRRQWLPPKSGIKLCSMHWNSHTWQHGQLRVLGVLCRRFDPVHCSIRWNILNWSLTQWYRHIEPYGQVKLQVPIQFKVE